MLNLVFNLVPKRDAVAGVDPSSRWLRGRNAACPGHQTRGNNLGFDILLTVNAARTQDQTNDLRVVGLQT